MRPIFLILLAITIISGQGESSTAQYDDGLLHAAPPPVMPTSESGSDWDYPMITEVYYNTLVPNEFVVITNQGETDIELSNWTISDREGVLAFPPQSILRKRNNIAIAQDSSLYSRDTLETADYQFAAGDVVPMTRLHGTFWLRNEGDEVILSNENGTVVDAFVYGSSDYSDYGWEGASAEALPRGYIARRVEKGGWFQDTNSSRDWDQIRMHILGQSNHDSRVFEFEGFGQGILSPDDSLDALTRIITSANKSIYLNAYTFASDSIGQLLLDALDRGLDVKMLVEGGPVGGMGSVEYNLLMDLRRAGAIVQILHGDTNLGVKARYQYNHAKYLVVDNSSVLISSENWGESGFPSNRSMGNRGWSVWLASNELSNYFSEVFLEDWDPERMDSVDITDAGITPVAVEREDYPLRFSPPMVELPVAGNFRVTPVIGPDTLLRQDPVIEMIRSSKTCLNIQQFIVDIQWGDYPNYYLQEAVDAAKRGVAVRVLLDASDYNIDNESVDNDDAVDYLNEIARTEGIPLQAKLGLSDSHQLLKFHNKGIVVDKEKVLISSINWNLNSVTRNREIGIIVENIELASFFDAAFQYDWKDDVTPPIADAGDDIIASIDSEIFLSAEGSRDNRGIAQYLWDINGDLRFDLVGPVVSLRFTVSGIHVIMLKVVDHWNNSAMDWINVTVQENNNPPPPQTWSEYQTVTLTMAVLVAAIGIFAILRRKQ